LDVGVVPTSERSAWNAAVFFPTATPTAAPTAAPTNIGDTKEPTAAPTNLGYTHVPTASPTAAPTNVGDTHMPTASPTATPTAAPIAAPTSVPTFEPTAAPTLDINSILNWADLKATCADSDCDTANGGCTITLSGGFVMGVGSYTSEIDFSGKNITLWGKGKVLDALGNGRFFKGEGAGSFLELHDAVLQNGRSDVSFALHFWSI
jgi:hypothetical protein